MNNQLPAWLRYFIIFVAFTALGWAGTYYIDATGLLCGLLAVVIFRQLERGGR